MARDLKADRQMLLTVQTYAQNRDWPRAGAIAERALAEGFEHPLLLNVVATRLELAGRFEDAVQVLERAVEIAPRDFGVRNALALCLQRVNRPAAALTHVDELLRQHPNLGFAHANKGNALIALGWLERARHSHLRALELEPGNVAALAALASIASHRGRHDEARALADKVLVAVPGFPDAVLCLAAAELAAGATHRAETLLRGLLADGRVAPIDRARAQGLLGDVLDAVGRFDAAYEAYLGCNALLRDLHREFASGTSPTDYARALGAALDQVDAARWAASAPAAGPAADVSGHVFLLGFPRSGTTLLEVALDGHPRVASLDEHELLTESVARFLREPPDLEALLAADAGELDALRAAYWERVKRAEVDVAGKLFVDKHPLNTLKLPLIARLFPRAKVLFAVRDPRDVVFSCIRRRFRMNAAMYELLTPEGAAAFYAAVMDFADRAQAALDLDWQFVRYEALVTEFELRMAEICAFLGLDPVTGLGDFASRAQAREHATPSTAQLARGLDPSGIDHWRHYREQLRPILPILDQWAKRLGYPA